MIYVDSALHAGLLALMVVLLVACGGYFIHGAAGLVKDVFTGSTKSWR